MLLLIIVAGVVAYFGLFFSKIQIQQVEIAGNQKVATADIEKLAWENINTTFLGLFPSQSIFLENPNALKTALLKTYPQIGEVNIRKMYPSSLSVVISERQPFSVFCDSSTNCFSIDTAGVIFEKVQAPVGSMIISSDPPKSEIFAGEDVVNNTMMLAIGKIQTSLKQALNIDIAEALVSDPLIITTSEKWKIYFDPTTDIDLQITKLNILLKNQISASDRKTLQYIYLQYKDRAYYK
jgi:cell division septal protein FtsQ